MMVPGMTDDNYYNIPEVAAMDEESERVVYCANKQFDEVRNCDHILTL